MLIPQIYFDLIIALLIKICVWKIKI